MNEVEERAAFERYMQNVCEFAPSLFARDPKSEKYLNTDVGWAWIGWQGARSQIPP
jgi:hypothetical protein